MNTSHLDRTSFVNKGFIVWIKEHHVLGGKQRVIPIRQDSPIKYATNLLVTCAKVREREG